MIDITNLILIRNLTRRLDALSQQIGSLVGILVSHSQTSVVNTWSDLDTLQALEDKATIQTIGRDTIYDGMSTRWMYLTNAPSAVIDGAKFKKLVIGPNTTGVFLNLDYRA